MQMKANTHPVVFMPRGKNLPALTLPMPGSPFSPLSFSWGPSVPQELAQGRGQRRRRTGQRFVPGEAVTRGGHSALLPALSAPRAPRSGAVLCLRRGRARCSEPFRAAFACSLGPGTAQPGSAGRAPQGGRDGAQRVPAWPRGDRNPPSHRGPAALPSDTGVGLRAEERFKRIWKNVGPGKMVPFQRLTQSLFVAPVSGRGCSSIGNAVSPQRHAGRQLRTWQQGTTGSSCPRLPASGRPRPPARGPAGRLPSRLAPAHSHRCAGSAQISRCRRGADGWPWEPSKRTLSKRPARSDNALPSPARAHGGGQSPAPTPGHR